MLDYVSKINNKYYLQTFLEDCKYKMKTYKMKWKINYDFETNPSNESDNDLESESDNESDNNEPEKPFKKFDTESEKSAKKSDIETN